jgi:hypothetical protein
MSIDVIFLKMLSFKLAGGESNTRNQFGIEKY